MYAKIRDIDTPADIKLIGQELYDKNIEEKRKLEEQNNINFALEIIDDI